MKRCSAAAILAIATLGGAAAAQEPIAADAPIRLNQEDALRFYPDRAQRMGISSWARVRCIPDAKGAPHDCIVVGEGRPDLSFGDSLIKITRLMRVEPQARARLEGKPTYFFYDFRAPPPRFNDGPPLSRDDPPPEPVRPPPRELIEATRPAGAEPIGMATVQCAVSLADGRPYDCVATAESPAGQGYGPAAVSLASAYRANPDLPETVDIRISSNSRRTAGAAHWDAYALGMMGLTVAPDAGVSSTDLPDSYTILSCQWMPEGRLRKCIPNWKKAPKVPRRTLTALKALTLDMRLIRRVMFNVNWGQ
jgi:hypothetical protein